MLSDIEQPAKDWIADVMLNLALLLGDGENPSFTMEFMGAEIEIRLNSLPGHFERRRIEPPDACADLL